MEAEPIFSQPRMGLPDDGSWLELRPPLNLMIESLAFLNYRGPFTLDEFLEKLDKVIDYLRSRSRLDPLLRPMLSWRDLTLTVMADAAETGDLFQVTLDKRPDGLRYPNYWRLQR